MKTRTENLPSLHPATIASLVGRSTLHFAKNGSVSGTVEHEDLSAVYQARNVSRELVGLVVTIRRCRGNESVRDLYQESLAKLEQVAGIAVVVDDAGFPDQLAFAMKYARDPATPRRLAVFKAWQHLTCGARITSHLTGETRELKNPTKAEFHALAEHFHGEKIPSRTFDDDISQMKLEGFQKRPPGKPRKAG